MSEQTKTQTPTTNAPDIVLPPVIVGFSGKARAGKTTAAKAIVHKAAEIGDFVSVRRFSFAQAVKACAEGAFGFTADQLYGEAKGVVDEWWDAMIGPLSIKKGPATYVGEAVTPRRVLQLIGHGFREMFGTNIWVYALLRQIDDWEMELQDEGLAGIAVIDDVRYTNEAQAICRRDGVVVRLNRAEAGLSGDLGEHPSETDLDDFDSFDYVLDDLKVDELRSAVVEIARSAYERNERS